MKWSRWLRLALCVVFIAGAANAQTPPKREFRSAWVATVTDLDWPTSNTETPDVQRAELITILDNLKAAGITAVIFQIRPECDALYASSIEPWSYWLTGHEGTPPNPLWDPLQFAIDESHKRGMELHAWFNPYRAIRDTTAYPRALNHVSVLHPDWILRFSGITLRILNPGIPDVRAYVTSVIMDVVRRYDIDGVHFDDYFYPYPSGTFNQISTEDTATFHAYPRGFSNIDDWRRDNVNLQMKMIHDSIQAVKPFVKFGISPFGIWKDGVPSGITGLDAYSVLYGDAMAWLHQHSVDYLTPQLYWRIGGPQDYSKLMPWWADSTAWYNRHLYTGHIYGTSYSTSELPNQVRLNRANPKTGGSVFFRAGNILDNTLGFTDSLRNNLYHYPSLEPVMAWKDTVPPNPPRGITYASLPGTLVPAIQWELPITASDGDSASRYAIYRFNYNAGPSPDVSDPRNMVSVEGERFSSPPPPPGPGPYYYYATALDRNFNESIVSSPLTITGPATPALLAPANGFPSAPESVTVSWHAVPLASLYHLQMGTDPTFSGALLVNDSLGSDTLRVIHGLRGQSTYYWRVSAMNAGGSSTYSGSFSFTTGFPLVAALVYPANFGLDLPVSLQFRWSPAMGASSYRLQLARAADFSSLVEDTSALADTAFQFSGLQNYMIYYWRVKASNVVGSADWSASFKFRTVAASSVSERTGLPASYDLEQNYPNPFNPATTIRYAIPRAGLVRLEIFDVLGRRVAVLVDGYQEPGIHEIVWDAQDIASGVYFYRLTSAGYNAIKRMILVR